MAYLANLGIDNQNNTIYSLEYISCMLGDTTACLKAPNLLDAVAAECLLGLKFQVWCLS